MSLTLTDKFIKGLEEYNLSFYEIQKWKYCGGNLSPRNKYFRMCCPDEPLPDYEDRCVCGHRIVENCYITDGEQILVLGNCCVKRFIPKCGKTCEKCEQPHKNRKVNRCNDCRIGICDNCNKECNKTYKICYKCFMK